MGKVCVLRKVKKSNVTLTLTAAVNRLHVNKKTYVGVLSVTEMSYQCLDGLLVADMGRRLWVKYVFKKGGKEQRDIDTGRK